MGLLDLFRRDAAPPRKRAYEAASPRRPWGAPVGAGLGNGDVAAGLPTLRAKSRHAVANNPWARNGTDALTATLVGSGITPASGVADPTARAAIAARFTRWAERADADGKTDFYGFQAAATRAVITDGEIFITWVDGKLRLVPADRVDVAFTQRLSDGRYILCGIEFDASGQRIAYHVRPDSGGDILSSWAPPIRVPASEILHVYRQDFPGQIRGVPWLAPALLALNELDQLLDALQIAAKISAMHAGFVTDMNATGTLPYDGTQEGSVLTGGLEPGTIKFLPAGFDIKFSSPQQALASIELAGLSLRAIAAGLGLPEHLLTGDVSRANYSSMRAALVAFRPRLEQLQYHMLIPQFLRPVWRRWLSLEIISGRVSAPGFEADPESWLAVEFYPPPQQWVDPLKDAEAEATAIAAGLKSRRQAVAERGYDIETLDVEIAADRAREASLGLAFPATPKGTPDAN